MSLVAVRVRELAEGGEDGGRVLLGDARGLRRVSGGVRARETLDPAAVAERRAIHEQILAINRRLENLKGSLSDLTVRLGAHSATVTLPPPTESA